MSVWPESSRRERSNLVRPKSPSAAQPPGEVVVAVEEHPRGVNLPRPVGDRRKLILIIVRTGPDPLPRGEGQDGGQTALESDRRGASVRVKTRLVLMAAPFLFEQVSRREVLFWFGSSPRGNGTVAAISLAWEAGGA